MKIKLLANEQNTLHLNGTHFRVIESVTPFKVRFEGGQRDQEITLERGMAFEPMGGYKTLRFLSTVEQEVTIEAVNGLIFDNRINGTFDYNAALTIVQAGAKFNQYGSVDVATVAAEVRPFNETRQSLLIQVSGGTVWIGSDANVTDWTGVNKGIRVGDGGSFVTESKQPLFAISDTGATVIYSEDYN